MKIPYIPLSKNEIVRGLLEASNSSRRRYPKLLHKPGDEFNRVFNFTMGDSYMQPHLHPGEEKIEEIFLVKGRLAIFFFDDSGSIIQIINLKEEGVDFVRVPAYTWHTYVMLTNEVITYETMEGKYDPKNWKSFAPWAPLEGSLESLAYLEFLKARVANHQLREF